MSRYCKDWREISIAVKEKANWKCNNCGADFKEKSSRGSCLQVHHWNMTPEDNRAKNLVALCNTCHLEYPCHLEYHRGRKGNILVGQLSLNL